MPSKRKKPENSFTCAGIYSSKFEQTREIDHAYATYQYTQPKKAYDIYQEVGRTGYARALYYVGLINAHSGCPECVGWLQACIAKQHRRWSMLAEDVLGEWYFKYSTPPQPEEALKLFTTSFQRGSIVGKYWLARWQMRQGDKTEGIILLRQAAEAQLKAAQLKLGWLTFHGVGVKQDELEGLQMYELGVKNPREAPDQYNLGKTRLDEPRALFRLGVMFQKMRYTSEACWWLTLATKQKQRDAQWALGKAYLTGKDGVSQDTTEGVRLLQLAVTQNQAQAQFVLGHAKLRGRFGLLQDTQEGLRLLQEAVSQNQRDAQYELGRAKLRGILGVGQDTKEGMRLLQEAVSQNQRDAQYELGRAKLRGILGVGQDTKEGMRLLQLAANQGHPAAQIMMGLSFLDGVVSGVTGFVINWTEGIRWVQLAVDQNYPEGLFYLGHIYINGLYGISSDTSEGFRLLQLAAEQKHQKTLRYLATISSTLV